MKRLKQRARYTLYCLILSLFSCSISLGTKTPYATSDITFNVYSRDSQLVTLVHSVSHVDPVHCRRGEVCAVPSSRLQAAPQQEDVPRSSGTCQEIKY